MIHVPGAGFCDDQLPVLSTIGMGPRGPKGDVEEIKFADPIEWDIYSVYERLTIVTYDKNSYISKSNVPVGIGIENTNYWVNISNYDANIDAINNKLVQLDNTDIDLQQQIGNGFQDESITTIVQEISLDVDHINKTSYLRRGCDVAAEFDFPSGGLQGCTWLFGNTFIVSVTIPNTNNINLYCWDKTNDRLSSPVVVNGYHANSVSYNPKTNYIYICDCLQYDDWSTLLPTITIVDADTFSLVDRINPPLPPDSEGFYSFVYDRDNDVYWATAFRGTTDGQANRVFKYNSDTTEIIGYVDVEYDFFSGLQTIDASHQGVQYVKDGILYFTFYNTGIVCGYSSVTGERLISFAMPRYANNYLFVGELEAIAITDDRDAYAFTQQGVFEIGIWKPVAERPIMPATENKTIFSAKEHALYFTTVDYLDTKPFAARKYARTPQHCANFGLNTGIAIGIGPRSVGDVSNVGHSLNLRSGSFALSLGTQESFPKQITIAEGAHVRIYSALFTGDPQNEVFGLPKKYWINITDSSSLMIRNATFTPLTNNAGAIGAILGSKITIGADVTLNNNASVGAYNGAVVFQPVGTNLSVECNPGEKPKITSS